MFVFQSRFRTTSSDSTEKVDKSGQSNSVEKEGKKLIDLTDDIKKIISIRR